MNAAKVGAALKSTDRTDLYRRCPVCGVPMEFSVGTRLDTGRSDVSWRCDEHGYQGYESEYERAEKPKQVRPFLKLTDIFDEPNPRGTYRRLMANDPRRKSHADRRQIKERRKQGAKARCKR